MREDQRAELFFIPDRKDETHIPFTATACNIYSAQKGQSTQNITVGFQRL